MTLDPETPANLDREPMRAAFDLRPHKEAMRALFGELRGEREQPAAVALEALINGPDFAALSVVDAALGAIKALSRGTEIGITDAVRP